MDLFLGGGDFLLDIGVPFLLSQSNLSLVLLASRLNKTLLLVKELRFVNFLSFLDEDWVGFDFLKNLLHDFLNRLGLVFGEAFVPL